MFNKWSVLCCPQVLGITGSAVMFTLVPKSIHTHGRVFSGRIPRSKIARLATCCQIVLQKAASNYTPSGAVREVWPPRLQSNIVLPLMTANGIRRFQWLLLCSVVKMSTFFNRIITMHISCMKFLFVCYPAIQCLVHLVDLWVSFVYGDYVSLLCVATFLSISGFYFGFLSLI